MKKDIYQTLFEHISEDENNYAVIISFEDFMKIPAAPQLGADGYYMDPERQREIMRLGIYGYYLDDFDKNALEDRLSNWDGPRLTIMLDKGLNAGEYITINKTEYLKRTNHNYMMIREIDKFGRRLTENERLIRNIIE
jgi:hypothetical protein